MVTKTIGPEYTSSRENNMAQQPLDQQRIERHNHYENYRHNNNQQ
jgi:hypothetical protein